VPAASRGRLRGRYVTHQVLYLLRGLDTQLAQQAPAKPVLAYRLAEVSFRKMDADERSVGALPERLACKRGYAHLERLAEPSRARQPIAKHVQCAEAELPKLLALHQHPIVVPVGQEIVCESIRRELEDVLGAVAECSARERLCLAQVDLNAGTEAKLLASHLDEIQVAAVQSPKRGA